MKILLISLCLSLVTGCSKQGPMHWEHNAGDDHTDEVLVCNSSGLQIAIIMHDGDRQFSVFGGNGKGYGEYVDMSSAIKGAVRLANDPPLFGRNWMT